MLKNSHEKTGQALSLDALVLECQKDKYKLSYAALRWAKEIKQKENLPDAISHLLPRALREILINQTSIKEVEKLPFSVRVTSAAPAPAAPPVSTPTITLKPIADDADDDKKEG